MKRACVIPILSAALLLLVIGPAQGATVLWQAWIHETDSQTVTLAWDANPPDQGVTHYEVKTHAKYPSQEWVVTVAGTAAAIPRPRAGLFRFGVRACRADGCGDWAYSDGPAASVVLADGQTVTHPWGMFWRLSPVIIQ